MVGQHAGVDERARQVVGQLRARLDAVAATVAELPRQKVAVVEWVDPPFSAGHWVPDLVLAAGGEPVAHNRHAYSLQTTWPHVVDAGAEVILVAPCGFHLDGAIEQAQVVIDNVPDIPVWAIDADSLVVRPGPRLVDGVEAIAAMLHPEAIAKPPAGSLTRVR